MGDESGGGEEILDLSDEGLEGCGGVGDPAGEVLGEGRLGLRSAEVGEGEGFPAGGMFFEEGEEEECDAVVFFALGGVLAEGGLFGEEPGGEVVVGVGFAGGFDAFGGVVLEVL